MNPASWALFAAAVAILGLLCLDLFGRGREGSSATDTRGRRVPWRLDGNRKTEIISNRRLGSIQRHREEGGALEAGDQIVVWAREFLDDDILYQDVLSNVRRGIAYFYILDRLHTTRFSSLLDKLYNDIAERNIVDEAINVVFVRPELTLNNFVILGYQTERQCAYSSLIFDERPFGWVKQDALRAQVIMQRFKALVAGVALAQAAPDRYKVGGTFDYFRVEDQLMDFSRLGRRLLEMGDATPERARFNLRDVVSEVPIPVNAPSKVIELRQRVQTERANEQRP